MPFLGERLCLSWELWWYKPKFSKKKEARRLKLPQEILNGLLWTFLACLFWGRTIDQILELGFGNKIWCLLIYAHFSLFGNLKAQVWFVFLDRRYRLGMCPSSSLNWEFLKTGTNNDSSFPRLELSFSECLSSCGYSVDVWRRELLICVQLMLI